jgi:hypothetical protein
MCNMPAILAEIGGAGAAASQTRKAFARDRLDP